MYRIPSDGDGWILIRDDNGMSSDTYDNPIELIENAEIEGKRLLEIIDDIRDISLQ